MRLEHHDDAACRTRAHRVDRRADLGRVMRVVIDDGHARGLAELFEPPAGARERRERLRCRGRRDAACVRGGKSAGGVPRVVHAKEPQRDGDRRSERAGEVERHAMRALHDLDHSVRRVLRQPVRRDRAARQPAARGERETRRAGIVRAGRERPSRHHAGSEVRERGLDVRAGREDVDVIVFHIQDKGDLGIEREERAVVLVRLDDEHVPRTRVRVRTDVSQHGTADERRIEAAGPKRRPDKRRGRALAVGPGDRDHALTGGELAPSVLALPDGETHRARGGHLDVRVAVRARADDDVRTGDVPRVERAEDACPGLGERLRERPRSAVRARDRVAAREQQPRHRRHAHAADADDVEAGHAEQPPSARSSSAIDRAASGRPALRAAADMRSRRGRSSRSPVITATKRSGSSWLSGSSTAAPLSTASRAFAV